MQSPEAGIFLDKLEDLVRFLIPNYIKEGKNRLVLAIGCTGGKHRSVTLANEIYQRLQRDQTYGLRVEHRDLDQDAKRGNEAAVSETDGKKAAMAAGKKTGRCRNVFFGRYQRRDCAPASG